MFLLGGPAFSGKTLLAHLLNQGRVVCLDEPDVHDPRQRHRGIPVLRALFPDRTFPDPPPEPLDHDEAVELLRACEAAIAPRRLGMKTAGWTFVAYAEAYRTAGFPVIAMVRDIRDVLTEAPLPPWVGGEPGLNAVYRLIKEHEDLVDLWLRYEDLVTDTAGVLARISALLGEELHAVPGWSADEVHGTMFKLDRHELLRLGRVTAERVGIWRAAGTTFTDETWATAEMMGYGTD